MVDGERPRSFRLHVFRVEEGLGNACVLELPDGRFGVIDWETEDPETMAAFFEVVRGPIAFVAATHAHEDHTLGLQLLFESCAERRIAVRQFVYPASTLNKGKARLTRARLKAKELKIDRFAVHVNDFGGPAGIADPPYLAWGSGWDVRVLSPPSSVVSDIEERALLRDAVAGNETSLVILFRFDSGEQRRGLLTGDATPHTLAFALHVSRRHPHLSLRNDCLLVPHHGARNGLPEWLVESSGGAFVVSAPTASPHHPAPSTLAAAVMRCAPGTGELFCTSYARACREGPGRNAPAHHQHLIADGSCFGNIVIDVPERGPFGWVLLQSSADGERRRPYGYCRVAH